MSPLLTYVYCLVRSARRPALRGVPPAIDEAHPVRALEAGGAAWVVVSSVPADEFDEAALARGLQDLDWVGRRAMAHEAVVEHFLPAAAVLPMQLFTMFTSDERALQHVARDRARIDRILAHIERRLEWGLRLSFDEQAAREQVDHRHGGRRGAAAASGAAYLSRKRDLLNVTRVQLAAAKAAADHLYDAMARQASDARRRTATEASAPGSRLLLDAAFLVPARSASAFRSALRRHARKLGASGIVVSLTGPWPPYNFIDAGDVPHRAKPTKRSAAKAASAAGATGHRTRQAAPRGRTTGSGAR